jgi:hypothetical protein
MLKRDTVIVLGAAVSNEVGLPLGWDLKQRISEVLPHQGSGREQVREALFEQRPLRENSLACRAIRAALPKAASIDNLIEHRGNDEVFKHCAKVGIVAAILEGERDSKLFRDSDTPIGGLDPGDNSYSALFRLIVGNTPVGRLNWALDRVSFVNFNYDRCLEHYFCDWLIGYSGLGEDGAAQLVAKLKVVRPYGTVGALPIGHLRSDSNVVGFGAHLDDLDLNRLASNIKTFSEERASGDDDEPKRFIESADQLIFLGCAYHPQNLRLLRPQVRRFRRVYGTCYTPPPGDPNGHSSPPLAEFSAPTGRAFSDELGSWPLPNGWTGATEVTFQSHTSLQMITKYGAQWCDYEA